MKPNLFVAVAALLVASLSLPTAAWASAAPQTAGTTAQAARPVGSLQVGGGVIMLSRDGSPFASAQSNAPVFSGERLMVAEQSSVKVVYNDGCSQTYSKPGVYTISASCTPAAVATTGEGRPSTGLLVAGGIGAAAIIAAAVGGNSSNVPPVSH